MVNLAKDKVSQRAAKPFYPRRSSYWHSGIGAPYAVLEQVFHCFVLLTLKRRPMLARRGSNPLYKQLHFEDKVTYTGEPLKPAQCEFIDISELWSNRGSRIRTCDFHFMGVARHLFSIPHYNSRAGWI